MRRSSLLQNILGDSCAGLNWFLFKQYSLCILLINLLIINESVLDTTVVRLFCAQSIKLLI